MSETAEKFKGEFQKLQTDIFFADREVKKWEKERDRVAAILEDRKARHAKLKVQLEDLLERYRAKRAA